MHQRNRSLTEAFPSCRQPRAPALAGNCSGARSSAGDLSPARSARDALTLHNLCLCSSQIPAVMGECGGCLCAWVSVPLAHWNTLLQQLQRKGRALASTSSLVLGALLCSARGRKGIWELLKFSLVFDLHPSLHPSLSLEVEGMALHPMSVRHFHIQGELTWGNVSHHLPTLG